MFKKKEKIPTLEDVAIEALVLNIKQHPNDWQFDSGRYTIDNKVTGQEILYSSVGYEYTKPYKLKNQLQPHNAKKLHEAINEFVLKRIIRELES